MIFSLKFFAFLSTIIPVTFGAKVDSYCVTSSSVRTSGTGFCNNGDIFLKGNYIELGVNNMASFGTNKTAPSNFYYSGKKLGFIADFNKNGFSTLPRPSFAGDYFVPGVPLEGWIVQWTSSSDTTTTLVNEGLMGREEISPNAFLVTSTDASQSSLWVGKSGGVQISMITEFGNNDLYFTTSVTMQNIGDDVLSDVYYMRTVDPDQALEYYGRYETNNYVKYQPLADDGSDAHCLREYVHPTKPQASLVCAVSDLNFNFFLGLGTVHPNARVNHFGFDQSCPCEAWSDGNGNPTWKSYGGNDVEPTSTYASRMRKRDEAVHLVYKFPRLRAGENVQFSFTYILSTSDLVPAIEGVTSLIITQPTFEISGSQVAYSVISEKIFQTLQYYIFAIKPSVASTPDWYLVGTGSFISLESTHTIYFSAFDFSDGIVQLKVIATTSTGTTFSATKAAKIFNTGVQISFTSTVGGSCTFSLGNTIPAIVQVAKTVSTDPNPSIVRFFLETYVNGSVVSSAIGTDSTPPYQVAVDVSHLPVGQQVTIKALATTNGLVTQAAMCGIVTATNRPPSDIILNIVNPTVPENSAINLLVGSLTTIDPDVGQTFTYLLTDNGGGAFKLIGNNIYVNGNINFETTPFITIRIKTNDGQSSNCCFEKDIVITISNVNESPSAASIDVSIPENSLIGAVVKKVIVTDPDAGSAFTYSFVTTSAFFKIGTDGTITVKAGLDYETTSLYNLLVHVVDNGTPNLAIDVPVIIRITDVPEPPTDLIITYNSLTSGIDCDVKENTPINTVVAVVTTVDKDIGDSWTYQLISCTNGLLDIKPTGEIFIKSAIDYETITSISLKIRSTDSSGSTFTKTFTVRVCNLPESPTAPDTIECFVDEDRVIGDTVKSRTLGGSIDCQIPAVSIDGSTLRYYISSDSSITGNYLDAFRIQDCSGLLFVNNGLDYETFNRYTFVVGIASSGGGIKYVNVIVKVVNVNEPPTIKSTTVYYVNENSVKNTIVIPTLLSNVIDPDIPSSFIFTIEGGNTGGVFYFSDSTIGQLSTTIYPTNYESQNIYDLIIRVTDQGGLYARETYRIHIRDVNEKPKCTKSIGILDAVEEFLPSGQQVGIKMIAIDEDFGQTLSLSIVSGNINDAFTLVTFKDSSDVLNYFIQTSNGCCDSSINSQYNLVVNVTDNGIPALSTTCTYIVEVVIAKPTITLPSRFDFYINENSVQYTHVGQKLSQYVTSGASCDVTFSITDYKGDGAHTFGIEASTGQLLLMKTYLDYELTPNFAYHVTATDCHGKTAITTIYIHVLNINDPPVFGYCPDGRRYENDVEMNPIVDYSGSALEYEATDEDSSSLTFAIVSVNGNADLKSMFTIVPQTPYSIYLETSWNLNYEWVSQYDILMSVTDGATTIYKVCTMKVENINEVPTLPISITCFVSADATAGTELCDITATENDSPTDPNGWGSKSYSITSSIPGVDIIQVGGVAKVVLTNSVATNGWLPNQIISGLVVRDTDGGGLFAETSVTIQVNEISKPPCCPSDTIRFTLNANSPAATVIGQLFGTDTVRTITNPGSTATCQLVDGDSRGHFSLSSDCLLTTTSVKLDYSVQSSYHLSVKSIGANGLVTYCNFYIDIVDPSNDCRIDDQVFSADENIAVGVITSNGVRALPVKLVDIDNNDAGGTWSITCVNCGTNPFGIDSNTGLLSLITGHNLDYETRNQYTYRVSYTCQSTTPSALITININNVNEAPVLICSDMTTPESDVVTLVGYIHATDPDYSNTVDFTKVYCGSNCGLSYSMVTTNGPFWIDATTGALSIGSSGADFESGHSYYYTYRVVDAFGLSSTCTNTITVTDVPDCKVTSITDLDGDQVVAASTLGGTKILINGRNFGLTTSALLARHLSPNNVTVIGSLQTNDDPKLSTWVFPMECEVHRTASCDNTQLLCTLPPGVGANLGVVLTIKIPSIATCVTPLSTSCISYAPPVVNTITPGSPGTVILTGTNLGVVGVYNTPMGTYSNSYFNNVISCQVIDPHQQVLCPMSDCYGSSVSWKLNVGGQSSNSVSNSLSCSLPIINSVTNILLNTTGGDVFYVDGFNFGEISSIVQVTYGPTGYGYTASCIVHTAGTLLRCTAAPGIGYGHALIVKVADLISAPLPGALSYKCPVITMVYGPGALSPTTGNQIVYLSGSQFGPFGYSPSEIIATYGPTGVEYLATGCTLLSAHTNMQCLNVPGTGKNHKWQLTIATQKSNFYEYTAYSPPVIYYYTTNGTTSSGSLLVYITGSNFGHLYSKITSVTYTGYNNTIYDVTSRCSLYSTHTVIRCEIPPNAGFNLVWTIIVDGQSTTSPSTSFGPPYITLLTGPGSVNASVYGGQYVNITGGNFGPPNAFELYGVHYLEWVKYGPSGTEYTATNCKVFSPTLIRCLTVPGIGGDLVWVVRIAGQISPSSIVTTNYAPPTILSLVPSSGNTDGTTVVTIYGENFATNTNPTITFDGKIIPILSSGLDLLKFIAPEAVTVDHQYYSVLVTVGGQVSNPQNFSYLPPVIYSVNVYTHANGTTILNIIGSFFSLKPIVHINVNGVDNIPSCPYKSHYEINCIISMKEGEVTVATGVAVSNMKSFQYGEPVVLYSTLLSGLALTTGYTDTNPAILVLVGQNFGSSVSEFKIIIENQQTLLQAQCHEISFEYINKTANPTGWAEYASLYGGDGDLDYQRVTCELPPGQGANNNLKVKRGVHWSLGCGCNICTSATCFTYLAPIVYSITSPCGTHPCRLRSNMCDDDIPVPPIEWWHYDETISNNDDKPLFDDDRLVDDDRVVLVEPIVDDDFEEHTIDDDDMLNPTPAPSSKPSLLPTKAPVSPTRSPSYYKMPTSFPTSSGATVSPTNRPTVKPTKAKYYKEDEDDEDEDEDEDEIDTGYGGHVSTCAGGGREGFEDGPKDKSKFNRPRYSSYGDDFLLVCDTDNHAIRRVDTNTGDVVTICGGRVGSANGAGTNALFNFPKGVVVSSDNSFALVCDTGNNLIRKITLSTNVVTTLVGGLIYWADGVGTNSGLLKPTGIDLSSDDKFCLVSEADSSVIRKVILSTGEITTIAGSPMKKGHVDGPATSCQFNNPSGLSISKDNTYALIADTSNNMIRKLIFSTKYVSTYCGSGSAGGRDDYKRKSSFNAPYDVAISPNDDEDLAIVADGDNSKIRAISLITGLVSTFTGFVGSGYSDGSIGDARFGTPSCVRFSRDGRHIAIADSLNNVIRLINFDRKTSRRLTYYIPSASPTRSPTRKPTIYYSPTSIPTTKPTTASPTNAPTTARPTSAPTVYSFPTPVPSVPPSSKPTRVPSTSPTRIPTTATPSANPTSKPTVVPGNPSSIPTLAPSPYPSSDPSFSPSYYPTVVTFSPTSSPSTLPTARPSSAPSPYPTKNPIPNPTSLPSLSPTLWSTDSPSFSPSPPPTGFPALRPTLHPTHKIDNPHEDDDENPPCQPLTACGPSDGNFVLIIQGNNFGSNHNVFIGDTKLIIDESRSNDTYLVVHGVPSQGSKHLVIINVGNQNNTLPFNDDTPNYCYFSYFVPIIYPSISTLSISTCGSAEVIIFGQNFGCDTPIVMLGTNRLKVIMSSHTQIKFIIPPGQGKDLILSVTAGGITGYSTDTFSYIPPHIQAAFMADSSRLHTSSAGGRADNRTVVLVGSNFGYFNLSWSIKIGDFEVVPADVLSWSCSRIEFYPPPGCGRNLRIKLKVGGQPSTEDPIHFSYDSPSVQGGILPSNVDTNGGSHVTLYGYSLGCADLRVFIYDRGYKKNNRTKFPTPAPDSGRTPYPSREPTLSPSSIPTTASPSTLPSYFPSPKPSRYPTSRPTPGVYQPSFAPSYSPSSYPTTAPTPNPTNLPTKTLKPSKHPSVEPTRKPTRVPSLYPSRKPTPYPSYKPTNKYPNPTFSPTPSPPTTIPTRKPSKLPTPLPTREPTPKLYAPTTKSPTAYPTKTTKSPTRIPTKRPTCSFDPTDDFFVTDDEILSPTSKPTRSPTKYPTKKPTRSPTRNPYDVDDDNENDNSYSGGGGSSDWKYDYSSGFVKRVCGGGSSGYVDGAGTNVKFRNPCGVSYAGSISVLVCDTDNHAIRRVDTNTGDVVTICGGRVGTANGAGTNALFNFPKGVVVSSDNSFALVCDTGNNLIRKITLSTNVVTTLVGGLIYWADGVGTNSGLLKPTGIDLSSDDKFCLVSEADSSVIRKVILSTGEITTIAGSPMKKGHVDGPATSCQFNNPSGLSISKDNTYALIADTSNNVIRKFIFSSKIVSTLAGSSSSSGSRDGIGGLCRFSSPYDIKIHPTGEFALISDSLNSKVRKLILTSAAVTTLTGSSVGLLDGEFSKASFNNPLGLCFSPSGAYGLVADANNYGIRQLEYSSYAISSSTRTLDSEEFNSPSSSTFNLLDSSIFQNRHPMEVVDGYNVMEPTELLVSTHNDTHVEFVMPAGAGSDLLIMIVTGNQRTVLPFAYSPPVITRYTLSSGGSALGGEVLKVYGLNFGSLNSPLRVFIGESECIGPELRNNLDGTQYIECTTPPTTVGDKQVSVQVAFHYVNSSISLPLNCKKNSFGGVGEACTVCGVGTSCPEDGMYEPISTKGFYISHEPVPNPYCSPESQEIRTVCPAVLTCIPSSSCLGANQCARGYTGTRCGDCDDGFYRINGQCQQCPNSPWAIIFAVILAILVGGYIAYKLAQKNVSLGILAIGIDYVQVLGVFGTANVEWPQVLITMYNSFSIFNFNIDVMAPGCWHDVDYTFRDKWITISILPLVTLIVCGVVFYSHDWIMNKFGKLHSRTQNFYKFFAIYLMFFYYGYIMLANNTLAIFNCQPTTPSDGHKYMVEVGTNGGRCYQQDSLQQQLEPWAILCLIFYVIGFPTYVGYILFTNRDKVMYAQVIRASGSLEAEQNEKPAIKKFKAMYNRLYYQFKPEFYYWVFIILSRKFCLTISAVIFRENIVFLLALYLLILFAAYTLQVSYQPYMSTAEYPEVVVNYSYMLNEVSQEIIAKSDRKVRLKKKAARARLGGNTPLFQILAPQLSFFNNYNTVESTLLMSGIFICIAGIMFQSGQLSSYQTDTLASLVILIVSCSLGYFAWVVFGELWIAFYPDVPISWLGIKPASDLDLFESKAPPRESYSAITFENQNPMSSFPSAEYDDTDVGDSALVIHGSGGDGDEQEDQDQGQGGQEQFHETKQRQTHLQQENYRLKKDARTGSLTRMLSIPQMVGKQPKLKKGYSDLCDEGQLGSMDDDHN